MPNEKHSRTVMAHPHWVESMTHARYVRKAAGWHTLTFHSSPVIRHAESAEDPAQRVVDMWAGASERKFAPREGVYSVLLFPDVETPETVPGEQETKRTLRELTGETERRALAREVERLKSLLIAEKRGNRSQADRLKAMESRLDGALQCISELTTVNRTLHAAVLAGARGALCLHETHRGVVTDVEGDEVVVVYETNDGPLEQVYTRQQFREDKVPDQGDNVTAYVILTRTPKDVEQRFAEMESQEKPDEFAAFREKGVSGPIEI